MGVHSGISSNRSWTDKLTKKNTRSTMIVEQPNHGLRKKETWLEIQTRPVDFRPNINRSYLWVVTGERRPGSHFFPHVFFLQPCPPPVWSIAIWTQLSITLILRINASTEAADEDVWCIGGEVKLVGFQKRDCSPAKEV